MARHCVHTCAVLGWWWISSSFSWCCARRGAGFLAFATAWHGDYGNPALEIERRIRDSAPLRTAVEQNRRGIGKLNYLQCASSPMQLEHAGQRKNQEGVSNWGRWLQHGGVVVGMHFSYVIQEVSRKERRKAFAAVEDLVKWR